jgi:hypothetical protein
MSKRDIFVLPPPTKFLTLEEIATRWRRTPITTRRLLRKFDVTVHRLTSRDHLYAIADIESIEQASQVVAPKPRPKNWDQLVASKRQGASAQR